MLLRLNYAKLSSISSISSLMFYDEIPRSDKLETENKQLSAMTINDIVSIRIPDLMFY